jgi:hypothetical protein
MNELVNHVTLAGCGLLLGYAAGQLFGRKWGTVVLLFSLVAIFLAMTFASTASCCR